MSVQEFLESVKADEFLEKLKVKSKELGKDLDSFIIVPEVDKLVMYKVSEKEARLFLKMVRSGVLQEEDTNKYSGFLNEVKE